jgi:hypothetical protein
MDKIEVRSTAQSAEETAGSGKIRMSPFLRLEKQTIRTLTGAQLKLVGGGGCTGHSCSNVTCGQGTYKTELGLR